MKKTFILILSFTISIGLPKTYAQFSRYIIHLKDKNKTNFSLNNPDQFLTARAIDRRKRYHIAIDETDLPVISSYIDSIRLAGNVTILNSSKWFNQVCIQTNDNAALAKIIAFSFVTATNPVAARILVDPTILNKQLIEIITPFSPTVNNSELRPQSPQDFYNYGQSYPQINLNNTAFLHNHGFRGEGMQLSIMDAGFYHYLTLPTFDSARNNHQILGTWDFVGLKESVNEEYSHGMNCLSTIAANMPGTFVGSAPKTSFYLYRTEDVSSEYPVEEQNWVAAAERADSLGVDIFSVSLGYTTFDSSRFDHTYADLNGHTTLIAKAADLAAKKGIIVVVAVGNEGNNSWHYMTTPADGDSVLAVGAVDINQQVAGFSSYGPNSNGQIKPDVSAVGLNTIVANAANGQPAYGSGTSFACPIMAGLTSCLWQAFPEINNRTIINALRQSSNKAASPDNRTGYGIPDAKKAFVGLIKKLFTQQVSLHSNCKTSINIAVKTAADMSVFIERKLSTELVYSTIATKISTSDFALTNFNFEDDISTIPVGSIIKYRFKMSIAADTTFYLDSTTIGNLQPCITNSNEDIKISPNPVKENLSVLITRNNLVKAAIKVYNASGQILYSLQNVLVNGQQLFSIPMKNFSRGIYFVSVYIDNKKIITKKVIR